MLHTYDEFGNRARVVLLSGSPIARRSQCCMHADTSKFSSGSSTSRLWFNVCRQVGSPEWAGRRTLQYVSSEQETDCLLHMLGVGNVLSTTNLLVFSLKSSVVIESNTNRNICSMENTKIKARRACKLLFTKKQAKGKRREEKMGRKKKLVGSSKPHTFSMCFPWLRTDAKIV